MNQSSNETSQNSKNIWVMIVIIVVTSIVVGGMVYAWQSSTRKSNERTLKQIITSMQSQIDQLRASSKSLPTTKDIANEKNDSQNNGMNSVNKNEANNNDNLNKFTSKNGKLSFFYIKDWICKEVAYGERVDCYPESRISDEYDAGLDQNIVYMPDITIQISNCSASKTLPPDPDNVIVNSYIKDYNGCKVLVLTESKDLNDNKDKLDIIIKP